VELGEGEQGGAHQVDGVVVAERLAEHVVYTCCFKHCTHATAGNNAGTGGRGLEQHGARAVRDAHIVRDGAADERHTDHVLLGIVTGLADRLRDLGGLAFACTDHPLAVTHYNYGAEVEPAASADHFGHAVDLDQLLFKL
jgi:hypothetical protein